MHTFQVFTYAAIITTLQAGYAVPAFFLSDDEWQQLNTYITLQSEQDMIYAAVLSAPEIVEGDRTHNSLEDDIYFEETREGAQR